jgi:alcohol dehydrogenase (NADP+)
MPTKAYAAQSATSLLAPFQIQRREVGDNDVQIEIDYCGVCHSDLHMVKNEWGWSTFPLVPGHEIVGRVTKVGKSVKKFKVGDLAGVGCFVDSCRECQPCKAGEEQYCDKGFLSTYSSLEKDGKTLTYGGYSANIVVDENYTLKISKKLPLEKTAPLLCAGITTYSPLMHWKVKKGDRVGVVGLGGLGHMAVKFAAAMGAEVTVLSTSKSKEKDALGLGAHKFAVTKDPETFTKLAGTFNLIIDAVSAPHDYNSYLNLLKANGTMVLLGVPPQGTEVQAFSLIGKRRQLGGSLIGGIKETQEMLDYCAEKNITSDVEVIPIKDINGAYERMLKGDVRYRFVIDMKTL